MRSFWWQFGGKFNRARLYGSPQRDVVIEPFAGSAGYSCYWEPKKVILVEKAPLVCAAWRFLIKATHDDVMDLPIVEHIDELPAGFDEGAKGLISFNFYWLNKGDIRCKRPPPCKSTKDVNRVLWGEERRAMIAKQVHLVNNWEIIEGDYTLAPDIEAHYHTDPPYKDFNIYAEKFDDYERLAKWCKSRWGVVDVCECQPGGDWLPFQKLKLFKSNHNKGVKYYELLCRIENGTVRDIHPGAMF